MVGSRRQSQHDDLLRIDLVVRRDQTTGCHLSFGRGLHFRDGEEAIRAAIRALEAQLADGPKCPANPKRRTAQMKHSTEIVEAARSLRERHGGAGWDLKQAQKYHDSASVRTGRKAFWAQVIAYIKETSTQ